MRADVDVEGDVAHRLEVIREDRAVVAGRRVAELGPLVPVVGPLEVARVHDAAADVGAVAADELGRRVEDDVDAVLDRARAAASSRLSHRTGIAPCGAECAASAMALKSGTPSAGLPMDSM